MHALSSTERKQRGQPKHPVIHNTDVTHTQKRFHNGCEKLFWSLSSQISHFTDEETDGQLCNETVKRFRGLIGPRPPKARGKLHDEFLSLYRASPAPGVRNFQTQSESLFAVLFAESRFQTGFSASGARRSEIGRRM